MSESVEAREHRINRGLFRRSMTWGIETDAFVVIVILSVAFAIPALASLSRLWWYILVGAAFFAASYFSLRLLFKKDPRFFAKLRHYFRWNSFFRARPSLFAERARVSKASRTRGKR